MARRGQRGIGGSGTPGRAGRSDRARQPLPARALLDYGKGGNPRGDLAAGVRDYLVQLGPDLFLGKAYYALGPLRTARTSSSSSATGSA